MAVLDLEKLTLKDGSTVGDRLRAFTDALEKNGKRGITVVLDENQCPHIYGHLPETDDGLVRLLEELAESLRKGKLSHANFPTLQ